MKTLVEKKKLFRKLDEKFGDESSDIVVQIIEVEMETILKEMHAEFANVRRLQAYMLSSVGFVALLMTIYKFLG